MMLVLRVTGFLLPLFLGTLSAETFTWKNVSPEAGAITSLTCETKNAEICFVVNQEILYRSTDAGRSWKKAIGIEVSRVISHPLTSQIYLLPRTPTKILVSSDHGVPSTFSRSYPGLVWNRSLSFRT